MNTTRERLQQVDGTHYSKLKIDPFEYAMQNGLDGMQLTIIKYVTRFRDKNGVTDLRKAIHTIERLIEFEERKSKEQKAELDIKLAQMAEEQRVMSRAREELYKAWLEKPK